MPPRIPLRALESATRGAGPSFVRLRPAVHIPRRLNSTEASSSRATTKVEVKPDPELTSTPTIVIPPLSRPLGIDVPPKSGPKTYEKKSEKLFDTERTKAERKVLLEEASRGYFHDYNRTSRTGGKQWIAPKVLIREDKALYFPNIAGKSLAGNKACTTDLLQDRVSLVSISSTRLSEEHIESFVRATLDDQEEAENPLFQHVQINHQENQLKASMISFFTSGLKRHIPQAQWSKYILAKGRWSELDVNQPMGIDNKIVGYVYLVDQNCKVRWAGCGTATDEEVQTLRTATAVLLSRSEKRQ